MKKDKKGFSIAALLMASVLTLAACGSGSNGNSNAKGNEAAGGSNTTVPDKVYEINVNNFNPSTGTNAKNVLEPWKKLVEEKTKGRVKVNLYHGGALGGSTSVLKDVKGGVYDMGTVYSPYHQDTEIYPLTAGDLPFASSNDVAIGTKAINEFYNKYKDTMLKDVELVGIMTAAPSNFFSKKPIAKVEDFKGLRIRAAGKSDADTIKEWGAIPVSVAITELYDALQKGIIDVTATADVLGLDGHLYEVAPHHIALPFKVIQTLTVINKATFNKLPEDLKALFRNELFPAYNKLNLDANINDQVRAKDELKKVLDGKGTMTIFPDGELNKLKAQTKAAEKGWIDDANKRGLNGAQLIKEYQEFLNKASLK